MGSMKYQIIFIYLDQTQMTLKKGLAKPRKREKILRISFLDFTN